MASISESLLLINAMIVECVIMLVGLPELLELRVEAKGRLSGAGHNFESNVWDILGVQGTKNLGFRGSGSFLVWGFRLFSVFWVA